MLLVVYGALAHGVEPGAPRYQAYGSIAWFFFPYFDSSQLELLEAKQTVKRLANSWEYSICWLVGNIVFSVGVWFPTREGHLRLRWWQAHERLKASLVWRNLL